VTNRSPIKMRHFKPCMGPEWLHKLIHSLRVLCGQSQTHAGIPVHSKDACNTGTVDSARSSLAHHRPRVDLNARMTSVAPAQNGAFMHIPTKTPRVHGLTTPTHARRRAGHPLAGGRL